MFDFIPITVFQTRAAQARYDIFVNDIANILNFQEYPERIAMFNAAINYRYAVVERYLANRPPIDDQLPSVQQLWYWMYHQTHLSQLLHVPDTYRPFVVTGTGVVVIIGGTLFAYTVWNWWFKDTKESGAEKSVTKESNNIIDSNIENITPITKSEDMTSAVLNSAINTTDPASMYLPTGGKSVNVTVENFLIDSSLNSTHIHDFIVIQSPIKKNLTDFLTLDLTDSAYTLFSQISSNLF